MTSKSQNIGSESSTSDTSHTETAWTGADSLDEWTEGPAKHVHHEGESGGTLLGPAESKKYNDASGFVSEGKVETKKMDDVPEDAKLLHSLHPDMEQQHSIQRIMSRPVKIATITYSANQVAGQLIGSYDVMPTIRTNSRFRLLREKLSSFYGVHMTAHLKVTLNPQPMESGLFQIFFIPYFTTEGSVVDVDQFRSNYESTLPYTTGCPNIPCNISKQSEVELAIPYTGPVAFINLTNPNADFGKFWIQNIVPITDNTNNASCELSVYMFFTNVRLFGTTPNSAIATGQALDPESIKPSECDEDAMKRRGPISTLGNSLLPVLDQLGLSAPDANPNPQRMVINPYASPATVDTTSAAIKTSYTFKHHLTIGQLGVNSQADEMDLKTIMYKPCYYNQFTWNTAQDADTALYAYPVEPNCVIKNAANTTAPTRMRYVCNNFRYWRGTIRYMFMIVCNQYHSGRLRFVYTLGGDMPAAYADNYPRTFSQVVDIRKGAHFIIEVPYFASAPWRLIPQRWDDTRNRFYSSDTGSLDDAVPMLTVFVENELRSTQSTSTAVQVVCMVGCGSDFEVAVPIATRNRPYINLAVPDGNAVATPQGLDFQVIDMTSGTSTKPGPKHPHEYTVGESITSVRQLIKRYQLIGTGTLVNNTPYILYPFAQTRPEGVPTLSYDALAVYSALYQFRRGSIRFMFAPNDSTHFVLRYDPELGINDAPAVDDNTHPFGDIAPIRTVLAFPGGGNLLTQNYTCSIPFKTNLQGGMEVEFPYYSRFHKLKTAVIARDSLNSTYSSLIAQGRVPSGMAFFVTYNNTANNVTTVYRSAADDYTLGYLLGAPLCAYRDRI